MIDRAVQTRRINEESRSLPQGDRPNKCLNNSCLDKCLVTRRLMAMAKSIPKTRPTALGYDSPEQRVFLHLWRTYDLLKAIEEACLSSSGVTAQQYNVLRILRSVSPQGMQTMHLGQRMISRGPDITRMLDRLERAQLIKRTRRATNRRVVDARITEAGEALLDKMSGEIVEMHKKQVGHLSKSQQEELVRLLKLACGPHEDASCGWIE